MIDADIEAAQGGRRPAEWWRWALGGAALGLARGPASCREASSPPGGGHRRTGRRRLPARLARRSRTPGAREATPVVVDNTPPTVALSPPRLSDGVVLLDAEAEDAGSGVASVGYMVSTGGPEWTGIPSEFAPERPGVYWFCAVAADRAGNKATSEPMPVQVGAAL